MTTYATKATETKEDASSWVGQKINGSVVIWTDANGVPLQKVYGTFGMMPGPMDITALSGLSPIKDIPADMITTRIPQHGQNVASPKYYPPTLVYQPSDKYLPLITPGFCASRISFLKANEPCTMLNSNWMVKSILASSNLLLISLLESRQRRFYWKMLVF